MTRALWVVGVCAELLLAAGASPAEGPGPKTHEQELLELAKNDAQFQCMSLVTASVAERFSLDGSGEVREGHFANYPVEVLPDGTYQVTVTYSQSGVEHRVNCRVRPNPEGGWSLVEKRELK